jgi:coiled-coil and C2 domain-containing protein 2A
VAAGWRRHASTTLRAVLQAYEAAATALRSSGITKELQALKDTHELIGFPVHLAQPDPAKVADTVKLTRLHELDAPATEFALAAYVHAFPNNIVSAWVYVAALTRAK